MEIDFEQASTEWKHNKFRSNALFGNRRFRYSCSYEGKKCNSPPHNAHRSEYSKNKDDPFYKYNPGLCTKHLKMLKNNIKNFIK